MPLTNLDPLLNPNFIESLYQSQKESIIKIKDFIEKEIEPPFSISIDGSWGSGKTTFMLLLKKALEESKFPTFWFNPWEYKGTENVTLLFMKKLASEHSKDIGEKSKKVGFFFRLLAVSSLDLVSRIVSNGNASLKNIAEIENILAGDRNLWIQQKDIIDEIKVEFIELTNLISKVHDDLPLIIFMDDFDRCLPDDTLKLLESIKNLFCVHKEKSKSKVIFICGINKEIAKYFISKQYHLGEDQINYATNYFKKIFNISISMPHITYVDIINKMFTELDFNSIKDPTYFINYILDNLYKENIKSIRSYQKIVVNFFTIIKLNIGFSLEEHKIIIKLVFCKEIYPRIYDKIMNITKMDQTLSFEGIRAQAGEFIIRDDTLTVTEKNYFDKLLRNIQESAPSLYIESIDGFLKCIDIGL